MLWKSEWKPFLTIVTVFFVIYFLPIDGMIHSLPVDWLPDMPRFENAFWEALSLAKWYAREHVLLCLVPAFFIAGAVGVFVSQAAVMKYLGPKANKILAYGVASVSGSILAVCSCTILPLFAGIYRMGAGLGPASAFLYSGPAINILAIVLTAAVLGPEMGVARAVGAVSFSKGCYPGQEIVARARYLGSVKRKPLVLETEGAIQPAPGDKMRLQRGEEWYDAVAVDSAPGRAERTVVFTVTRAEPDAPAQ
ncbi:MAG: permease, partial [Desulfuromonadales bacterium]